MNRYDRKEGQETKKNKSRYKGSDPHHLLAPAGSWFEGGG